MIGFYAGESRAVCDVFYDAIHVTAATVYRPEQVAAWAPLPRAYAHWAARCALKRPFLFRRDGDVVGFIEVDPDGHIDCHYVAPSAGRSGVGGAVLDHALTVLRHAGVRRAYVEASHLARGLYLKRGFVVVREQHVVIRGVRIDNALMELPLA